MFWYIKYYLFLMDNTGNLIKFVSEPCRNGSLANSITHASFLRHHRHFH
jgi:hypothetical protein